MDKVLLCPRTINEVLKALNQPLDSATEACAIVRILGMNAGLKLSDDPELSGGDFKPWMNKEAMLARAESAVSGYEDWCHINEAEFSGWGDQIIPAGATKWTRQAKLALSLLRDEIDPLAVLPPLPEGWFLLKAEHSHTRIVYRGDRHEPLPHADGAWFVELQHLNGGRATSERGKSLFEAATAAIRSVQLREKEA